MDLHGTLILLRRTMSANRSRRIRLRNSKLRKLFARSTEENQVEHLAASRHLWPWEFA